MFIDSHCHLDRLGQSKDELGQTLAFARQRGVEHFLCVAVSVKDFEPMLQAIDGFDNVSASCGVHPLHQDDRCERDILLEACSHPRVVAVGETGLDYYYSEDTRDVQMASFIDHIHVANAVKKPLIIHTRDARQDTLDTLRQHLAEGTRGVLHCFTESLDMALAAIDLGFYISFSGIVTFNSAKELREVAKQIPLERMLIETDSPWLAPVPHRGKQNQPGYVVEVAECIAKLRGVSVDTIAKATSDNFFTLFDRIERHSMA
ncbi:TatD family hydrolase [Alteromonas facilis]|uniref:TatD family hydrolase n=1 Tax=Alteromonas facilis TaxID=2048004 RepID=UPI000C28E5FA|nr:TatD family hydrolase [Alteromonas facilis]